MPALCLALLLTACGASGNSARRAPPGSAKVRLIVCSYCCSVSSDPNPAAPAALRMLLAIGPRGSCIRIAGARSLFRHIGA
jgi:hypothetical protein